MTRVPPIFYHLPQTIAECFRGKYFVVQLLAIALSIIIVTTNLDWAYYETMHGVTLRSFVFPAVTLGGLIPIFVPLSLLLFGIFKKRTPITNAAWGIAQSAMLGFFLSSFYKAFTGRIPPRFADAATNIVDASHGFQFGFLRGGIFWGWPSSHATVAFAMAATFATLFPKQRILTCVAFLYASYVAFGVSVSIHWLSEATAGIFMGTVIGLVVGKSFSDRLASIEKYATNR